HETGHSLGLAHSTSGTVMYPTITGIYAGLKPDDIAGIQAIYGARKADQYDAVASNNSQATARSLALSSGGFNISADLTTLADVDYYKVVAPSGTNGTLTVTLNARDVSLLIPQVSVLNASGTVVGSATAKSYGSVLTVSLSGLSAGQTYTIKVDGATSDVF